MPTARENIERGLKAIGLACYVGSIVEERADRIIAIPSPYLEDELKRRCEPGYAPDSCWKRDAVVSGSHGKGVRSYREASGCHPAMQICFRKDGKIDVDYDYAAAGVDVVSASWHSWEFITNWLTGRKTDQRRVASLLDRRFPESGMEKANG